MRFKTPNNSQRQIISDILTERDLQSRVMGGVDKEDYITPEEWIVKILKYLGEASDTYKTEAVRRGDLVRTAAAIVGQIEAIDRGA